VAFVFAADEPSPARCFDLLDIPRSTVHRGRRRYDGLRGRGTGHDDDSVRSILRDALLVSFPRSQVLARYSFALPLLIGPSWRGKLAARMPKTCDPEASVLDWMAAWAQCGPATTVMADLRLLDSRDRDVHHGIRRGLANSGDGEDQSQLVPPERAGRGLGWQVRRGSLRSSPAFAGLGAVLAAVAEPASKAWRTPCVDQTVDWHNRALGHRGRRRARRLVGLSDPIQRP